MPLFRSTHTLTVCLMAATLAAPALAAPATPASSPAASANTRLRDTPWVLQTLDGQTPIAASPNTPRLVLRAATQQLEGHTGCNRLKGRYTQRGTQLAFKAASTTRMACAPELMAQEQRYLRALASVDGYRVEGGQLSLLQGEAVVATFAARRGR